MYRVIEKNVVQSITTKSGIINKKKYTQTKQKFTVQPYRYILRITNFSKKNYLLILRYKHKFITICGQI